MLRSTTILLLIAVAVVAVALVLRSGDGGTAAPTTTSGPGSSSTSPNTTGASSSSSDATTTTDGPATTVVPSTLPPGATACDPFDDIVSVGVVSSPGLVEASGLAVSRTTPNVLWSHNDSGDDAVLHAFDDTGADLGTFTVPDAFNIDWEDMAAGPAPDGSVPSLYVGDMGDNLGIRDGVVYIWRVPDVDPASMDGSFPESAGFALQMPGGPYDAEALFVDPVDPAIYIVTKSRTEARVFRGPLDATGEPAAMDLVATLFLDAEVSGADISVDGSTIALRGYRTVWMWNRAPGQTVGDALAASPCTAPSADEVQGESIAFDAAGGYFTVSEGTAPDLYFAPATP